MVYQSTESGNRARSSEGKTQFKNLLHTFCILDPVAICFANDVGTPLKVRLAPFFEGTTTLELAEGMLLRGKNDKI